MNTPLNTVLTRTGALTRLAVRRERRVLMVWIVLIAVLGLGTTSYYLGLFATEAARAGFAHDAVNTPALLAFNGELYGTSLDAMSTWRMRDLSWTLIALMAVLTVIRHTRTEEESGRQELVGAAVVGRYAPLTAALVTGCAASVAAAGLTGLGLVALGLDPVGSLAFAVSGAVIGAVFAGVGAVAAQLAQTGRGALGIGVLTLGASYVLRFVADGGGLEWLKWFTPLGWAHLARPFGGNLFAVPLVGVLVAAVLAALAYLLVARRDFGAGLLPVRPGPTHARHLHSPVALAWRLHRGLLAGWVTGFAVAGLFFGALVAGIRGSSAAVANSVPLQLFIQRYTGNTTASMDDAFLWVIALTLGYTAALYPALAVLRLRSEEASGRAEVLLSAPVDRLRWVGGHLLIATLGTAAVLAAGGLTAGLAAGLTTGDIGGYLPQMLAGTLIQIPAAWTLGAVTMLAFGLLPRTTAAVAWAGFLFIQVFEVIAPIAGIGFHFVEVVIPYWHLPRILAGGQFTAVPLLALTVIAGAMVVAGLAGLRHRDMTSG